MARLAGVDIPNEKRIEIALTYIFGVGRTRAKETLAATGISPDIRVKDLTDEQLITLRDYLEANYKIEGDLRRDNAKLGRMTTVIMRTCEGDMRMMLLLWDAYDIT